MAGIGKDILITVLLLIIFSIMVGFILHIDSDTQYWKAKYEAIMEKGGK